MARSLLRTIGNKPDLEKTMLSSVFVLLLSVPAQSVAWQPVEMIKQVVLAEIGRDAIAGMRIKAEASVDPRLQLPACTGELVAQKNGDTSVKVECAMDNGWQIHVPVRIQRFANVVVLTKPINAGEVLNEDDVAVVERDVAQIKSSFLTDPAKAVEHVSKRSLPAGSILTTSMLSNISSIKRGQPVTVIALASGIEVSAEGKALQDGGVGDMIKVQNLGSRRIINGTIAADGRVVVKM